MKYERIQLRQIMQLPPNQPPVDRFDDIEGAPTPNGIEITDARGKVVLLPWPMIAFATREPQAKKK